MLKLKAAVSKATTNIFMIYELRNILKKDVYENAFGDKAKLVRTFNTTMGVISWIQLASDIKHKRGWRRIMTNQMFATGIVIGHNLYCSKDVREGIKEYLSK